jgi:PTH2 family peptidyl-tRNA hydrolase
MTVKYDVKQVLVVRKDLKMRMGKVAAQAAHASLKVLLDRASFKRSGNGTSTITIDNINEDMLVWLEESFAKICVYVESEHELEEIYHKASRANLPCAMIVDAGNTEFHGVPTKTVVAVGPARCDDVNKITGHLKLL